ncbi:hypothetical protein TB2_043792 [Malus domestica]
MCNGEFMSKEHDDALEFLDQIAKKTHQWKGPNLLKSIDRSRPSASSSSKGIYQLREEDELKVKYDNLAKEIAALKFGKSNIPQQVYQSDVDQICNVCCENGHSTKNCQMLQEMKGIYEERCAAIGSYQKQYTPFSETYNPATRNHPNLRSRNDSYPQVSAPNHQFSAPNSFQHKQSYVDPVQALGQKFDSLFSQLVEENKEIKSQLSKLTNSMSVNEKGRFPANTQANPKGVNSIDTEFEHAKSVITLRNGKIIDTTPLLDGVEKTKNFENHIPVILGRPFLATCDANIS